MPRPLKHRTLTLPTSSPSIFPYCHSQPPLDLHLTDLQRQGFWSSPSHSPQRAPPTTHSLLDRHVTICTSPVNPDLDIHPTGTFCIQIGLTYPPTPTATPPLRITAYPHGHAFAHAPSTNWHRTSAFLYNPSGLFIACLPIDRLLWLHDSYLASRASNHNAFHLHSSGDFLHDLASLFHLYPLPKTTTRPAYPNEYWSPPVCFCRSQSTAYPITCHRFATPLTVPTTSPTSYSSFHPADSLFEYSVPQSTPSLIHGREHLLSSPLSNLNYWTVLHAMLSPACLPHTHTLP